MVSAIRRFSNLGFVLLAGIMALSGCASRKYVRLQTQALEPAIQEASNGVKENAERIDAVDRRAQQGVTAAQAADQKATQAGAAAQTAQNAASPISATTIPRAKNKRLPSNTILRSSTIRPRARLTALPAASATPDI